MQEEEHSIPEMVEDVRTGKMPRRHFMKKLTTMGISTVGIGTIIAAVSSSSPAITKDLTNGCAQNWRRMSCRSAIMC